MMGIFLPHSIESSVGMIMSSSRSWCRVVLVLWGSQLTWGVSLCKWKDLVYPLQNWTPHKLFWARPVDFLWVWSCTGVHGLQWQKLAWGLVWAFKASNVSFSLAFFLAYSSLLVYRSTSLGSHLLCLCMGFCASEKPMQSIKTAAIDFLPWGLGSLEGLDGMDAIALKKEY